MRFSWFRDQVDYNAPWDIKMEKRWKEQMSSVPYLGSDKNGDYGKFMFDGRVTTAEEFGNFAFGYWGTATGYGKELLNLGAGSAQINEGIDYYFKTHPNEVKIEDAGDVFDGPVS